MAGEGRERGTRRNGKHRRRFTISPCQPILIGKWCCACIQYFILRDMILALRKYHAVRTVLSAALRIALPTKVVVQYSTPTTTVTTTFPTTTFPIVPSCRQITPWVPKYRLRQREDAQRPRYRYRTCRSACTRLQHRGCVGWKDHSICRKRRCAG